MPMVAHKSKPTVSGGQSSNALTMTMTIFYILVVYTFQRIYGKRNKLKLKTDSAL
jgi:cbb3-type cytochrome oxidase subunit 3